MFRWDLDPDPTQTPRSDWIRDPDIIDQYMKVCRLWPPVQVPTHRIIIIKINRPHLIKYVRHFMPSQNMYEINLLYTLVYISVRRKQLEYLNVTI